MTFELGTILMTPGIRELIGSSEKAYDTVVDCLKRHADEDWGDLSDDDRQMNDDALEAERNGEPTDRLFSLYETDFAKLYIITEYDRSVTTILLPEEY